MNTHRLGLIEEVDVNIQVRKHGDSLVVNTLSTKPLSQPQIEQDVLIFYFVSYQPALYTITVSIKKAQNSVWIIPRERALEKVIVKVLSLGLLKKKDLLYFSFFD